jgi:hypothetical protein
MIIFAFLLAIGSLLTLHSLFPVNNLSLTWIGILKYFFEFVFYHKIDYSIEFFIGSLIFFALLFISLLFLVIFLLKKFSFKKLTPYFFIFFILLNLLNYGVIFYDSKTNWHNEEQMQLGMWLNDHDSDKISNILFDEESCGSLKKSNLGGICGGLDNTKTVIGYWLNDNIVVGNLSNTENIDYIISKYKLNYPIFYQTKNIFVYQVN